jgi:Cdc6-like AAA superfamily ATPase
MSKCIIIVGGTGTGKTTEVCKMLTQLQSRQNYIFDVNNEQKYTLFSNKWNKDCDFEKFIESLQNVRNSNIIFEEATIFFSHGSSTTQIKKLLVQKRHTNNILFFNFHSLRQVPLFILDFCDLLILGKTKDNPQNIRVKFEEFEQVYTAFNETRTDENQYVKKYVKL